MYNCRIFLQLPHGCTIEPTCLATTFNNKNNSALGTSTHDNMTLEHFQQADARDPSARGGGLLRCSNLRNIHPLHHHLPPPSTETFHLLSHPSFHPRHLLFHFIISNDQHHIAALTTSLAPSSSHAPGIRVSRDFSTLAAT